MASGSTSWWNQRNLVILGIVHLVATWFMVGLIWTIHVVHYPLFAFVGTEEYIAFQAEHVDRIGRLLLIPWAVEGFCVVALLVYAGRTRSRHLALPVLIGAVAMSVVLAMSAFFSAPAHGDLADGFDATVHADLMRADLVRTLAWTVRGGTAVWVLWLFVTSRMRDGTDTTT